MFGFIARRVSKTIRADCRNLHRSTIRNRRRSLESSKNVTLEHFLLAGKSLKLYRDFLRATRNIPNPSARRETIDWLRDEHFEGPSGLRQENDIVRTLLIERRLTLLPFSGSYTAIARCW